MNESGDFVFESRAVKEHQPDYTARVDHSLTGNNRLSFSMFYRLNAPDATFLDNAPDGFQQGRRLSSHHYSTSDVWTLTSNMVNEVAFGYSRIWDTETAEFGGVDFNSLGFPYSRISDTQFASVKPDLSPSEFNIEAPTFKYEAREVYDIRDTFTWLKGRHFMKFGGMIQIHQLKQLLSGNQEYGFEGQWLGNRAAEFLIGWPSQLRVNRGTKLSNGTARHRSRLLSGRLEDHAGSYPQSRHSLGTASVGLSEQ